MQRTIKTLRKYFSVLENISESEELFYEKLLLTKKSFIILNLF